MKKFFLISLCLFLQLSGVNGFEKKKLYKWVDKNGNVHYSDEPQKGAKEIEMKEVPAIKMETPDYEAIQKSFSNGKEAPDEVKEVQVDYNIELIEPQNDGAIRTNDGTITLKGSLEPGLTGEHSIRFYLDGSLIKSERSALSATIKNVEYGAHTASVSVVDSLGKTIRSSNTHKFQVLKRLNLKRKK
ncbi:DUF4124 domain-containing protein [Aliikangiella sp. IMCC44359]|uniref:DUF4124 domain-containing protein n=1 Tax=Aliikangiella sp. IMCC44359 TaxID=3459125 RepID=UPI00403B3536